MPLKPVPKWLPRKYHYHWRHPWTKRARRSAGFRRQLAKHGYLTPHFKIREAACKHCGSLPRALRPGARNHAFKLERLRVALGDTPLGIISWYRCPTHNRNIGGARYSQHMTGRATDFSREFIQRVGRSRFQYHANRIWSRGGVGTYPYGSMHTDSRGYKARWSSY